MASRLQCTLLALTLIAASARAEDLSSRLEQLEREAATRPPPEPAPAEPEASEPPAAAAPAPAPASPGAMRLAETQERRARPLRELAAKAARRVALLEQSGKTDPESEKQLEAGRAERDEYTRRAEDVFRTGTDDYQAAYEEWLASESAPAEVEP